MIDVFKDGPGMMLLVENGPDITDFVKNQCRLVYFAWNGCFLECCC